MAVAAICRGRGEKERQNEPSARCQRGNRR
jgi:hypothetical protein